MFWSLRCHFCGKRSKYSTGTTEFQCAQCEAINFFDSKGNVVDPPQTVLYPAQQRFEAPPHSASFNRRTYRPSSRDSAEEQVVCQTCLNNQQMYMNTLNNYLPDDLDEDDPKYQEYIKRLPQMKADLEKRYPQVCKTCAPKVQEKIHKADYYGMSQHASGLVKQTRARNGQSPLGSRDHWSNWRMRQLLSCIYLLVYASLLFQTAWHAYGVSTTLFVLAKMDEFDIDIEDFVFEPTLRECAKQARRLHFEPLCYDQLSSYIPKALFISFCLLWYNPGLKAWYNSNFRVETVHGQTEHFRMQLILLIIRTVAWKKLSDLRYISEISPQKLIAAHVFMVILLIAGQRLSERPIKVDRWRIKGKIMPKPDEKDLFSETAGPGDERYSRHASSTHPLQLFARDDKPFPIENLAPKSRQARGYSKLDLPSMPPPSPPDTQSDSEDDDAMDIDPPISRSTAMPGAYTDRTFRLRNNVSAKPQTRSMYNHGATQPSGWGAMRNEVFGMQDQLRSEQELQRKKEEERAKLRYEPPVEQNPFRGRLPQAPMSMERKMRNPPTQLSFKQTPVSKQQDFMKQMRDSFESGKTFGRSSGRDGKGKAASRSESINEDDDDDFSPAKSRTRGGLDLKPSTWHLPGDGMQMTGLEDAFGGTGFGIADAPTVRGIPVHRPSRKIPWFFVSVTAMIVLVAAAWQVKAIRRPFCLWLVRQLEEMGL